MKVLILFALIGLVVADFYYTTGNDHLDIEAFLDDPDKVYLFMDCYLDRGPCPELAKSYKAILPEAIALACVRCNPAQKHIFWQFLQGLKKRYTQEYFKFRNKYDPDNIYFEALEQAISEY